MVDMARHCESHGLTSWALRCAEPINLGERINSEENNSPTLSLFKAFVAVDGAGGKRETGFNG